MVVLLVKLFVRWRLARIHRGGMVDHDVLLVDGQPIFHFVAILLKQGFGVLRERVDRFPVGPSAVFIQGERQVEVVQGHDGLDAAGDESVDERVVKRDTFRIDFPFPFWKDPAPRNGEPVRLEAKLFHERHVLLDVVVVVAGDREIGKVGGMVQILDGWPFAVARAGPLDLVGGCGRAP